ncbi:MAG: sigma-70 family RNA polymerase sigma factor [Ruminiclostridium sp.]|nr:sigma-70 family RNA polymerase sigma factor [Ruminiclostridium sp.]
MLMMYVQMLDAPQEKVKFEQVYRTYRSLMFRIAMKLLQNTQDAEDAVHNAFVQMIRHFSKISDVPCKNLTPWIVSIIRNESISVLRKRGDLTPIEEWDGCADTTAQVSDYHELLGLFAKLPDTYRSVMELKLLWGYSDGEIASRLGISKTAVSSRVNRGRAYLRNMVEQEVDGK